MAKRKRDNVVLVKMDYCPYLDTVNRHNLDFDFEKHCSKCFKKEDVYACLVCGKYYHEKRFDSHAYEHSRNYKHHVFLNLQTEKFYCLPDGYEIFDSSLDDIRHILNPRFTSEQIEQLDKSKLWSRALNCSFYLPGSVGLNKLKEADFANVVIQALVRVTPLRNFFLVPENYKHCKSSLVHRFGELIRKIWHPKNFKRQVNPHEFLQAVIKDSDNRFQMGVQSDPVEFMSWLLDTLHLHLTSSNNNTSIITQCFQGELEVVKEIQSKGIREYGVAAADDGASENSNAHIETFTVPFIMLDLDLPPPPLFKDALEKNIIPQVPLFNILKKFDREIITEAVHPQIAKMQYSVTKLPPYVIMHLRRFTKSNNFVEKNPTIVNFPVKNLEMKYYIALKDAEKLRSKYDLMANIVHEGTPIQGSYKVCVQRTSEDQWYEVQDLHVSETKAEMVALSEAYVLMYELQSNL
ncbi:U4/U6.U5 tri-snRNP-associated protein 2-like isoform X1 [Chenopodium quinoa]|uniref:U4/U6.U5 tri-snRNP-associated protein 2-like isoform X1 n=1 Tax=Chenopodium quinoa TaxID=63459 RepID=UPI000B77BE2E|nr:U4/U6.U5 tri-snRNP-associated protein 2-like isoform X1 [Chenopodium quinoa]